MEIQQIYEEHKVEPIAVSSVCLHNMAIAEMAVMQGGSPLATESIPDYNVLQVYDDLYLSQNPKAFFLFSCIKKKKVCN